jgi:hypothetical protein
MASITLIYICFLILLPLTVQHQCVQSCIMYLTFDETFSTLPSECSDTYENVECYSDIGINYASKSIQIKFGEQSINGSRAASDDYYISQETEMWHETGDLQWTALTHRCYHGDLCDFEYAKTKVFQMRKLTANFDQFQQELASALFTKDSGTNITRCLSSDGQIITCAENIKSCSLNMDNIYTNKTHQDCSSQSDDRYRKQLGIKEETAYYLNGRVEARQSSVEYVCDHELCNGQNAYKNVAQLLIKYSLIRDTEPIVSASNMKESMYQISLLIPVLSYFMFYF